MPSIISSGIGSGLDIAGIVQQLVAAEAQSVESRIGKQEGRAQVRLSAFGSLKAALAEFGDTLDLMKNTDRFLARKATSGDESLFTVSAGTAAVPASYSIEVLQTAQAQKLTSAAFADSDTGIGTGTLSFAIGDSSFDVEITSANDTLAGIRDAINDVADYQGLAATIVNAEDGSYLILTSQYTGEANEIVITQSGGDGGLDVFEFSGNINDPMDELISPEDARIVIDGLNVVSPTNTIEGAIDGVSLTLVAANPGTVVALDVVNDEQAVRETVIGFIDSYNQLIDLLEQLTSYDADSQVAGPLLGDSTTRGVRDQIRRELTTAVDDFDATFSNLSDIGITVQLDGRLVLDDTVLSAALVDDFSSIGQLFAAPGGFAVRLSGLVERYLDADGTLESRTNGLNAQIEDIGEQRDSLSERLIRLEERLYRQFNALDSLLAQLSQTSNFLNQQLASLPGFTTPSNGN